MSAMDNQSSGLPLPETSRPLVLDVDGTMIRSDITHEMLFEGAKRRPWAIPKMVWLGLKSKPALKQYLVARIGHHLAIEHVPLEPKAVALANAAKAQGRAVYLCSGSEESLVKRLGAILPYVDDSFGTTPDYNMTSKNKAAFLSDRFPEGFDYAGNSTQDYAVWAVAQKAYAIRPPHDTKFRTSATGEPVEILEERGLQLPKGWTSGDMWYAVMPGLFIAVLIYMVEWRNQTINPSEIFAQFDVRWLGGLFGLFFLTYTLDAFRGMANVHRYRQDPGERERSFAAGHLSFKFGMVAGLVCLMIALGFSALAAGPVISAILVAILIAAWIGHDRGPVMKWAVRIVQAGLIVLIAALLT